LTASPRAAPRRPAFSGSGLIGRRPEFLARLKPNAENGFFLNRKNRRRRDASRPRSGASCALRGDETGAERAKNDAMSFREWIGWARGGVD
jgi:hypothetical protein